MLAVGRAWALAWLSLHAAASQDAEDDADASYPMVAENEHEEIHEKAPGEWDNLPDNDDWNNPAEGMTVNKEQMVKLFRTIDKDGDGKIPAADFHAFAKDMRIHIAHSPHHLQGSEEAQTYFEELDTDKDDKVSEKEATSYPEADPEYLPHDTAKFKAADKNNDGYLGKEEFTAWEYPEIDHAVEEAFAKSIFDSKDANKDGFLEFEEYYNWMSDEERMFPQHMEDFKEYDANGDGKLVLAETAAVDSGRHHLEKAMDWLASFADTDKDGFVSEDEFKHADFAHDTNKHNANFQLEDWIHALEL